MIRWNWAALGVASFVICGVARAQPAVKQYPRFTTISYNPILTSQGNQRLHEFWNWWNPRTEVDAFIEGMQIGSHERVNMRLTYYLEMDFWPIKEDGFQYTEAEYLSGNWHMPDGVDYAAIIRNYDLARRVDRGEIDETAIYGAPYFGYWETTMAGYNGFYCNSGPRPYVASSQIFCVTGWNYERVVSLHATGHRAESTIELVYNGWDVNGNRTIFDRFGWNIGQTTISSVYGIGSAHLPANGDDHYDYANPQTVDSYAPQWATMDQYVGNASFPDPNGPIEQVNRQTWGLGESGNYEFEYFKWWYGHMPHFDGTNNFDGYSRLNNWWEYLYNFNQHSESNGDFERGAPAPPAVPYGVTPVTITSNNVDDWTPRVNDNGRMVWKADDGFGGRVIWSANTDGTDITNVSNLTLYLNDAPQINNSGRIVWQLFDGKRFWVVTGNSDGSLTGQAFLSEGDGNNWHPDINDSGRIVWDAWDGEDYEVFSANADGTDIVQITNNVYSGTGKRPDDCWPRINNDGRVVWMAYDGYNFEIHSANYDGSDFQQITSGSYHNEYPQISDSGKVVWHAWHSTTNGEVYSATRAGAGTSYTVTRLSNNAVNDWWPQVNDAGDVVWMQRDGNDWEVLLNGAYITTNNTHDQYPAIDNNGRITWQGLDGEDWEIYVYDDGTIYQLTDNDYDDWAPQPMTGGVIVWHGESVFGDPNDPGYTGPTTEIFSAVTEDLLPPTVESAASVGDATRVTVIFSEALDQVTAEDQLNYAVDNGIGVSAASLAPDQRTVSLTTSELSMGVTYTLTINDVEDLAGNPIAPGTQQTFDHQGAQRVTDGLVVLYDFAEGAGTTVHDVSGVGSPMDLEISDLGAVTWTEDGLRFDSAARAETLGAATKVIDACQATNEITLEAWIMPTQATQSGPGRIITIARTANTRNVTLGHGFDAGSAGDCYAAMIRTSADIDGLPGLVTALGTATTNLQHVAFTRDGIGTTAIYIDGDQSITGYAGGDFSNWLDTSNDRFMLGNEYTLSRPWYGEYRLVAAYDRALNPTEVQQNFQAGLGEAPTYDPGDTNCDGAVNNGDIDPFVLALSNYDGPGGYLEAYPGCNNADVDGDGLINNGDIDPFVAILTTK